MNRFRPARVVGYLMKSTNGKGGFIVQTSNFKAWGNISKLKLMLERGWRYVVLADKQEYGSPIGTLYLSRGGTYFNITSKQHKLKLTGWVKNLRGFLEGERNRAALHTRVHVAPELPLATLKIKMKGKNIYYRLGVEGSRYGLTLNHEELTALIRMPIPKKINYTQQILGDLFIRPKEDGTVEVGWLGSQRRLITTPAQLNQAIDKHFITFRMENGEWGPPILKPIGWEKESTPQETIFTKTHTDRRWGVERAKIFLFVTKNENDVPTWGADLCVQYSKSYKLVGKIKTPPTMWGNQVKRWAERDLRTIGRILMSS